MHEKERAFISTELGELFRKARVDRKLTQEKLAEQLHIHQTEISRLERGACQVLKTKILMLCEFFEMEFDHLSTDLETATDETDIKLQLISIEHGITMLDEGLHELKKLEELRKNRYIGSKDPYLSYFHFLRGKYYEKTRKWNDALEYYEAATLNVQHGLEETNVVSASFCDLGRICNHLNKLDDALVYIHKGIQVFNPNGERLFLHYHLYINKASVLEKLNRDSEALNIIEEIWKEIHHIDTADARLNLYQIRVELLIKLQRYDEAIEFALEALANKARIDMMYDRCFELWSSLGEAYAKKGMLANAEVCFQAALKLESQIRKKYLTIATYTQLGLLYTELGKAKLAQTKLKEAVSRGRKYQDDYRLVKALYTLGCCLQKQHEDQKALIAFQEAYQICEKHSFDPLHFDVLIELTELCRKIDSPKYRKYMDELQQVIVRLRKGGLVKMEHQVLVQKPNYNDPPGS